MENINKITNVVKTEPRRAKRDKRWLMEGNIIPLSTKEIKKIKNKEYRERIKKHEATTIYSNFNLDYRNELFNYLTGMNFTHKGSLTYNYNISMPKAYKDAVYIFELLQIRGIIANYFLVTEFEDCHAHVHYIVNALIDQKKLVSGIESIFNGKFKKGHNYLKALENDDDKKNTLGYYIEKLTPVSSNNKLQSEIDYWTVNLNCNPFSLTQEQEAA